MPEDVIGTSSWNHGGLAGGAESSGAAGELGGMGKGGGPFERPAPQAPDLHLVA